MTTVNKMVQTICSCGKKWLKWIQGEINSALTYKTKGAPSARSKLNCVNLRLCLHVEISSLCLFSVCMWGLVNRENFSVVQRLQRFVRFMYGFALAMIFQVTVKSLPSSSNFHRCLLSSVSFFLFSCLNDIWWFLYLALTLCYLATHMCVDKYQPSYFAHIFRAE